MIESTLKVGTWGRVGDTDSREEVSTTVLHWNDLPMGVRDLWDEDERDRGQGIVVHRTYSGDLWGYVDPRPSILIYRDLDGDVFYVREGEVSDLSPYFPGPMDLDHPFYQSTIPGEMFPGEWGGPSDDIPCEEGR